MEVNLDEEYAWLLTHNITIRIEFEFVGIYFFSTSLMYLKFYL
jgi:hypothetical protein